MDNDLAKPDQLIKGTGSTEDISKSDVIEVTTITNNNNNNTPNRLLDAEGHIYLIPTPTRDPSDPLNWHPLRKWTILMLLCLWSSAALSIQAFLLNFAPSVRGRFPGIDDRQLNLLLTLIMPMIAPGQLIFTPLAIAYGRRFSLLLAVALLAGSSLWGAFAGSYESLLAARVVEGLAAGPTDCLVYVMVQEMTFIHERGTMIGTLMAGQLVLQLSLSIATNYMAVNIGFPVPFLMFAAFAIFSFIGLFFIMPETRFDRPDDTERPRIKLDEYPAFRKTLGPYPFAKQIKPWSVKSRGNAHSVVWFFRRMGVYVLSPTMWWNAGINTIMCGSLLAASTYYAELLVSPPWSWAPQNVALINIGPALMSIVNWLCIGWGNDKVILWLAKRNNGLSRPEHRLAVLILPIATGVVASVAFGALTQDYLTKPASAAQPHWFAMVFVMALYYQSFCGILEGSLIYLANAASAEDSLAVMTLVAVVRDLVSFGMGYGIVDFSDRYGFLVSFGIYGLLTGVIELLGVPVYVYADWFREKVGLAL